MNRIILIYFALLFCLSTGFSQETKNDLSKKQQSWFKKSASKAQQKDFTEAIKLCDKILKDRPKNIDVILRKASFLYNDKNLKGSAEQFSNAIALAPDYDSLVYYSYGIVLYELAKYETASENFSTFLASSRGRKNQRSKAKTLKANADFTAEAIKNPVPFNPIRLPEFINNQNLQYLPALTADGKTLLYTERAGGFEELYISHLTSKGNYGPGVIFEDITMPQGVAAHCISPDGRTIIVTSNDLHQSFGSCDLFITHLKNGKWSKPSNMGPDINSATWDSQPSLSADGKTLYFSSRRRNGVGRADLYSCTKDKEGRWGFPKNLGLTINSTGDDESPFIHPDDHTLYFRSNGHQGLGDFDIFISRRDPKTKEWGKPQNLGYPINTNANDGALFVSLDGTEAYYTSDRYSLENNIRPNLDLYKFKLDPSLRPTSVSYVQGKVIDAVSLKGIESSIEINADDYQVNSLTDPKGNFLLTLPVGKNYAFNINKQGYLFQSERFELDSVYTRVDPVNLNIALHPIPKPASTENTPDPVVYNTPVIMRNILFESGSSDLKEISDLEISKLAELLKSNMELKIKIQGHTDNVGAAASNMQLSKARAEAVYQALVTKGIAESRMDFEGYGESQPISDNDSVEGRRLNRRTAFIVVKNN